MTDSDKSLLHIVMGALRKLMPADAPGENRRAVRRFSRTLRFKDLLRGKYFKDQLRLVG